MINRHVMIHRQIVNIRNFVRTSMPTSVYRCIGNPLHLTLHVPRPLPEILMQYVGQLLYSIPIIRINIMEGTSCLR